LIRIYVNLCTKILCTKMVHNYYNQDTINKSNVFENTVKLSAFSQKLLIIVEYFLCIRERKQIFFLSFLIYLILIKEHK